MRRLFSESIERFPLGTWCRKALILGLLAFGGCSALDTQEGYFDNRHDFNSRPHEWNNEFRTRSAEGENWNTDSRSHDISRNLGV